MWKEIKTSGQAIKVLGGPRKVAAMFADVEASAVSMWAARKRFPPKAWLVLEPVLRGKGRFSPALFDMLEPRRVSDGDDRRR